MRLFKVVFFTIASNTGRSGPSPTKYKCASGKSMAIILNASINSEIPLRLYIPATVVIDGYCIATG